MMILHGPQTNADASDVFDRGPECAAALPDGRLHMQRAGSTCPMMNTAKYPIDVHLRALADCSNER
jgi:hypothetical protein